MTYLDHRFLEEPRIEMERAFNILEIAATSPGGLETIPIHSARDELLHGIVDVAREFRRNSLLPGQEARQTTAVQRLRNAIGDLDRVVTADYSIVESDETAKSWFDYSTADMGRPEAAKILVGLWDELWERDRQIIAQTKANLQMKTRCHLIL